MINQSQKDFEKEFEELDISPKLREYINLTWQKFDYNQNGYLGVNEIGNYMNDVVSKAKGVATKLT